MIFGLIMAKVHEVEFPGTTSKVRIASTREGSLIDVGSLCKAVFLDPTRLNVDGWVPTSEIVPLLAPFMGSHPAVRSVLNEFGAMGVKELFPQGLTLAVLADLVGVSEAELMAEMPGILERMGR